MLHPCATTQVRVFLVLFARVLSSVVSWKMGLTIVIKNLAFFLSHNCVATCAYLDTYSVARNPVEECNPFIGEDDFLSIAIGVCHTVVSLGYAGWSITADKTMNVHNHPDEEAHGQANAASNAGSDKKVTGVVANNYGATEGDDNGDGVDGEEGEILDTFSNNWKLNILLGVVSCWYAMTLTSWGSIQTSGDAANPVIGTTSMWMIISSQWIALTLYLWTLVAPRLFPDRDFS